MTVPAPIHNTCRSCRTPKPVTAYHWRNRARGVRHSTCKTCRCEDERTRYNEREFDRIYLGGAGPRPLPAIAPINPPLPWGYDMTPEDVAAVIEAAESEGPFPPVAYGMTPERAAAALKWLKDIQNIPATTPASVVDPAEVELLRQRYERERNVWQPMMQAFDTPEADPDPMGDGSAWGWVTVATAGAFVALVSMVVWVTA